MKTVDHSSLAISMTGSDQKSGERGAALATAILMLALLSAIAMTVLSVVTTESRIAGSDLARTNACYASAAGIEKMTSDFSSLFNSTSRPTLGQLDDIAASYPTELTPEGYTFDQRIELDTATLSTMGPNPTVTIPSGPFGGLIASISPYKLTTTATSATAQCNLVREMNNYLIPLFQFGMFSDKDIELHPGPAFTFNGRVHANGNIYVEGNVTFLAKVTAANEFIYDVLRNGSTRTGSSVKMKVGAITVDVTKGSMNLGPNITTATATPAGQRGYFPGSPDGTINTSWDSTSVAAATSGVPNKFGGQLLTRTTGASALRLPLQLDGNPTHELIKRMMPNDSQTLSESRYHSKAEIRILIDDENPSSLDASRIPAGQGVSLSTFDPIPLPNLPVAALGGRALWRILDNNTSVINSYDEVTTVPSSFPMQQQFLIPTQADTVRGVKASPPVKPITGATNANPLKITCTNHGFLTGDQVVISGVTGNVNANGRWTITVVNANMFTLVGGSGVGGGPYIANTGSVYSFAAIPKSANGAAIPPGAGLTGHILIQIVDANGVWRDVTREILSMGVTVGEPNAIVQLQRPLWAAFTQGSRDSSTASPTPNPARNGDPAYANSLTDIVNKTRIAADGQVTSSVTQAPAGYLTGILDDTASGSQPQRSDVPPALGITSFASSMWNSIVPINVYNVREGHLKTSLTQNAVYERGITNIVEINMRNLARWMDGVYDQNLLANTSAVSANIGKPDGYILYVSDRRGDRVRAMIDSSGANINSSNGMADNEDIYGPNGVLDPGEDVQGTGALVKDTNELLDATSALAGTSGLDSVARFQRALAVGAWTNLIGGAGTDANNHKYFRGAVRLFNGENLQVAGTAGKLSTTLGITVATENMAYTWGNYNTTGINQAPAVGQASLNDPASASRYTGNQVPASIVCDAFFPVSKTWFDSSSAINPDDYTQRQADRALPGTTSETAVRTGIIAGNNLSALSGTPDAENAADSRLSGGLHNFPRFLEDWLSGSRRWNFVGSFVPLYHSTQALGPWWYIQSGVSLYGAPQRNWAFDSTFLQGDRLPPGTPLFQYIEPTGFRQVLY